jgi:hypothetical protein
MRRFRGGMRLNRLSLRATQAATALAKRAKRSSRRSAASSERSGEAAERARMRHVECGATATQMTNIQQQEHLMRGRPDRRMIIHDEWKPPENHPRTIER